MAIPAPDYHFLYMAPNMSGDWFFVAARQYWLRFRPILIDSLDLVDYAPKRRSVAITTFARRDTAPHIRDEVARRFPKAIHDALVYDYLDEMQLTLDGRAALGHRLGQPEG